MSKLIDVEVYSERHEGGARTDTFTVSDGRLLPIEAPPHVVPTRSSASPRRQPAPSWDSSRWPAREDRAVDSIAALADALSGGKAVAILAAALAAAIVFNVGRAHGWWQ